MEPRPFSHGYACPVCSACSRTASFNGATTFQPWILRSAREGVRLGTAPSMEPRPFSHGYDGGVYTAVRNNTNLQWSHDLSAMDTPPDAGRGIRVSSPSMEPRPFSHGYCWWSCDSSQPTYTFNGATTFQPWIPDQAGSKKH